MNERRYDTPPKNLRSLEQRLRNVVTEERLQLRTRRQIANMAVIAALRAHARDEDGEPIFTIKGGVAVELLIGLAARATKDLDATARTTAEEVEPRLREGLARGWDGFAFRLVSWDRIGNTAAHRGDIKLDYKGRAFEGKAGRELHLVGPGSLDLGELGLAPIDDVPLVTLAYIIAQKLHACTDHSYERPNDRARDLIDILLVGRLVQDVELTDVRKACVETFDLRGTHSWPPSTTVLEGWPEIYAVELAKAPGFEPEDVYEAMHAVNELIAQIDAAT
jgi:hypothetical protein